MGQLGTKLREARERQGISLREVEEATKIRIRYLEALENEDFGILPGRAYALGFLRSYAAYLGLDGGELTALFKQVYPSRHEEEITPVSLPTTSSRPSGRGRTWLVALVVVVVLAVLAFLGWNSIRSAGEPGDLPSTLPEQEQSLPEPLEPEPAATPPGREEIQIAEEPFQVEVRVVREACWMEVRADGALVYSGTLNAGQTRYWKAEEEVDIRFGLPAAVEVYVNGKPVGPVGGSSPVTRTFTRDGMAETGG